MTIKIYKKFITIFSVSVISILLIIMAFNYFIDPGNQFSHGASVEHKMAAALLANKKIVVQANYNERLLQKIMIEKMKFVPDIFVLGSSHIMPLTHNSFGANSFFNAAVSSASLEDDIALYYLLEKKGFQPKKLIICLDPWIVSSASPETLWKTEYIKPYYAGRSLILGKQASSDYFLRLSSFFEKYTQLLSSDYLRSSLVKFYSNLNIKRSHHITPAISVLSEGVVCPNCFVRQADGSRLPTPNESSMTAKLANRYVENNVNSWKSFWTKSQLDRKKVVIFELFVKYLVQHGVKVVFYFPPLEPLEYTQLVEKNKKYRMISIAQKYFNGIARKYKLKVVGSYDPKLAHISANYFIDSWHLKETGMKKLFGSGAGSKVYK